MPPIPIYAHSPINAAKASGVTPQTAAEGVNTNHRGPPPTTTQSGQQPGAQPGAPAMPAPTGASSAQQAHYAPAPQPTRTQPLGYQGPPPPQPNAFPVPFGAAPPQTNTATGLSPPPKAGEAPTTTQPAYYPPQMSIPAPAPAQTQGAQRGTATTISFGQAPPPPLPSSAEHGPPGYQQHVAAGSTNGLDRYQRAGQEALERDEQEARMRAPSLTGRGSVDGVWGSVKEAVAAAGGKIAAAEEEVWKRINKE